MFGDIRDLLAGGVGMDRRRIAAKHPVGFRADCTRRFGGAGQVVWRERAGDFAVRRRFGVNIGADARMSALRGAFQCGEGPLRAGNDECLK